MGTTLGFTAVIWDAAHGGRSLKYVLEHEYGLAAALAGWTLLDATGLSADGLVICGSGYDPAGVNRGWVARLERQAYWNFCFGDGSGASCPCLNYATFGEEGGCTNSLGLAGWLRASGTPSVALDTLVLTSSHLPATGSALYFQGNLEDSLGAGTTLGDGIRCLTGAIVRLGTKFSSGGTSSYPVGTDPRISVRGGVLPGQTRFYQSWYRNASTTFCTPSTFNYTNGVAVAWSL